MCDSFIHIYSHILYPMCNNKAVFMPKRCNFRFPVNFFFICKPTKKIVFSFSLSLSLTIQYFLREILSLVMAKICFSFHFLSISYCCSVMVFIITTIYFVVRRKQQNSSRLFTVIIDKMDRKKIE